MKLIIMRHGECIGLDKNIINGWRDFELTEKGKKEAKEAAKKVKETCGVYNVDKIYTSYLSRTRDTAECFKKVLRQDVSINQDIRLNERHYGFFQGMKREDAYKYPEYNTLSISADKLDNKLIPMSDKDYEEQLEEYSIKLDVPKEKLDGVLPRSESILDVQNRLNDFLEEEVLLEENKDKIILIVGHANTVKLTVGYILNLTFEEITKLRFATCGMTVFDLEYTDGKYVVRNEININDEFEK